ncbi:MAG: RNA methyltransferase PUA domain-containing protein, partial [Acidimicrobiales bacterium]
MRAHVFVGDVERPALSTDDRNHLERVLRLRPGDEITVSDGAGRWRRCLVSGEPVGDVVMEARPAPPVAVGVALSKGERPEVAGPKLTEVGVVRIGPVTAARSGVRWDGARAA